MSCYTGRFRYFLVPRSRHAVSMCPVTPAVFVISKYHDHYMQFPCDLFHWPFSLPLSPLFASAVPVRPVTSAVFVTDYHRFRGSHATTYMGRFRYRLSPICFICVLLHRQFSLPLCKGHCMQYPCVLLHWPFSLLLSTKITTCGFHVTCYTGRFRYRLSQTHHDCSMRPVTWAVFVTA